MKDKLLRNIELKILSVIIALILWMMVRSEKRADLYLDVRLELENLPSNLMVTELNSESIKLRLNGSKDLISKMDDKYFKPYAIDMFNAEPGQFSFKVKVSRFAVGAGIRVLDVSPKEIRGRLETVVEKLLPVEPTFKGKLDQGYEIESYDIMPEKIKVKGPRSQISAASAISTSAINLTGRKRSFVDNYQIILPSEHFTTINNIEKVTVNVLLREENVTRVIKNVPVRISNKYRKLKIEEGFVNVKISGAVGLVNAMDKNDISIIASPNMADNTSFKAGDRFKALLVIGEMEGITLKVLDDLYFIAREDSEK